MLQNTLKIKRAPAKYLIRNLTANFVSALYHFSGKFFCQHLHKVCIFIRNNNPS